MSTAAQANSSKKDLLKVSLSPHISGGASVNKIMWAVNFALLPALAVGIAMFGWSALILSIICVGFAVLTEFVLAKYIMKKEVMISDGSAVLTGILLAMNLPPAFPWWMAAAGTIIAIALGKMVFGGLGQNVFNPALVGRAFLLASFPQQMTYFIEPGSQNWNLTGQSLWNYISQSGAENISSSVDAVTAATALGEFATKASEAASSSVPFVESYTTLDLFLGNIPGSIGEISALALLIGGLALVIRKVIGFETPLSFLGGLALITGIFWIADPNAYTDPLRHILSGGAMLGAWFMATDMVTSPMTVTGRIVYGLFGGILCALIRLFGSYPEGCSYAILIMNALTPLIDRYIKPKRFGSKTVPKTQEA
jgi:electron transport complex protein RnfD